MQIKLPKKLKKWCYYDVNKFKYILKENAPKSIQKKYKEFEDKDLNHFKLI